MGFLKRLPVDFYGATGAGLLTEPALGAIDIKNRRGCGEVNAFCRAIIYTEGTFRVLTLFRVDLELNAGFGYFIFLPFRV